MNQLYPRMRVPGQKVPRGPHKGRLSPPLRGVDTSATTPRRAPRPEENFSRSISSQGQLSTENRSIRRHGDASKSLTASHDLLGSGTTWIGNRKRARSETPTKKFDAVVSNETKNAFSTRIAKYVASYARDGAAVSTHQFRTWKKWAPHLDWDANNSNLRDRGDKRMKQRITQDQWDMAGDFNDTCPPGRGVPATKTAGLASYRNGWEPSSPQRVIPHARGVSKAGAMSPPPGGVMQERPAFRSIFKPVDKSMTIGKSSRGADMGTKFSSMAVAEVLPDYAENMRQKRMLQNLYPSYQHSIEASSLKRLPQPARLALTFPRMRPYQKMNRFDGSPCRADEN